MSDQFPVFARLVNQRLTRMSSVEMFEVDVTDAAATYLAAFPEGTNPIFRERTEHDCSCCKQFIRNFGRTIAIIDGKRFSVWGGGESLPSPYREVAERMDAVIQQAPITGVFRTKERRFGAEHTTSLISGVAHRWNHFWGIVADRHRCDNPDAVRGNFNGNMQVLRRGLVELKTSAVDEVIGLIEAGALYKGTEFMRSVRDFKRLQMAFNAAPDKNLVVWENIDAPAARFRNTAIGTLVQDLSAGMGLEQAVRVYEVKVAPTNYKRTKALITPKMADDALKTLAGLGLEDAVERRFAEIEDVNVTDVLFVDNAVRGHMRGGLRDVLMAAVVQKPVKASKATSIPISEFVNHILPSAKSMTIHLKNEHLGNFMSITAPKHQNAGRLFQWNNGFAWAYDGDVADSIKERVKRAGGNTGAALRVSLAWSNYDDLDLHAQTPDGHIYYGNTAGILDVDMNVRNPVRDPVENLSWRSPRNGVYRVWVNNFNQRETTDGGFTLEVECGGSVQQFSCRTSPRRGENINCIEFKMQGGALSDLRILDATLHGGGVATEKWGVKTETPVRVDTMLTSPNHWEGAGGVGAKHWFFILEGCKNPGDTRGFFNEYLRRDLDPHRKVFEVLASRTKCEPRDKQLSGVGFTGGRGDHVLVTVTTGTGASTIYDIAF